MKFEELMNNLRESLKGLTTAENAPQIAFLAKNIDSIDEAYKAKDKELDEVKTTLVDVVKNTSFKTPSGEGGAPAPTQEKSLEEIMEDELNNIK